MLKCKITMVFMVGIMYCISAMAQGFCRYCNGTGQVEKNISVSQYGLQDYKIKCPICGKVTWKSTGHTHISCPKCGGSGVRSSSYSSGRVSDDISYNPESPEGMAARGLVYDMKYGLPHSEEENAAVKRLQQTDPETAKRWQQYRDVMNQGTMHFRYQMSIVGQAHDTVQMIDAFKNTIDQQLSNIVGSGLNLPNDLYAVYQKLYAYYNNCYQEYRRTTATHQSLRQLEEQIDNYRLMQNLFY